MNNTHAQHTYTDDTCVYYSITFDCTLQSLIHTQTFERSQLHCEYTKYIEQTNRKPETNKKNNPFCAYRIQKQNTELFILQVLQIRNRAAHTKQFVCDIEPYLTVFFCLLEPSS